MNITLKVSVSGWITGLLAEADKARLENAGLEKARTDWLWKADQA